MKKLLIVLLTSIFIAGCSSNDTEEDTSENNDNQSVEDVEKEEVKVFIQEGKEKITIQSENIDISKLSLVSLEYDSEKEILLEKEILKEKENIKEDEKTTWEVVYSEGIPSMKVVWELSNDQKGEYIIAYDGKNGLNEDEVMVFPEKDTDLDDEGNLNDDKDEAKLTEDEAKEKIIDYMKENEEVYIDGYDMLMEEEDNSFQADIFPSIPKDEGRGPSRVASYKIDRKTGDIERVDDWDADKTEPHISEIVDFSEEERRTHHENLAGGPEHIQEKVYEHLMLPGIHENTKKYEGRINPGERIRFRFPDAEKFVDQSTDDPEVSEDGYFTINLAAYEFKAGQDILVSITKGYPEEQNFILTVNEVQEGMEDIRVKE